MSIQPIFSAARPVILTESARTGRTCIVVPCFNEAERLDPNAFRAFLTQSADVDLMFVNDGSSDATLNILKRLELGEAGRVAVLDLSRNAGKANAVRQGMIAAFEKGYAFVGYWDADLATPLHLIPDFLRIAERMAGVDVIFGSRRQLVGHRIKRTFGRRVISRICATLARLAVGLPIGDTQCGAKVFRATPAVREALNARFEAGWLFDVELFTRIARHGSSTGHSFYELPLSEWTEVPGSKVSMKAVLGSGLQMLKLIARSRRPIAGGA